MPDAVQADSHPQSAIVELSNAIVRLQKKHYGRGPTSVSVHLQRDLVVVVMRDCRTTFEGALVAAGAGEQAEAQRRLVQREIRPEAAEVVESLFGRRVSSVLDDCDLEKDVHVLVFVLDQARP